MRADIGHRIGEKIGPLLLEQGRRLAAGLGGFINDLGLLPFLHLADDHPVARNDLQRIDGGILRQRKHINAFDKPVRRVFKPLGNDGARRWPRDGDIEIRGQARCFKVFAAFRGFEQQASRLYVIGGDKGEFHLSRPRLPENG